MISLTIGLFRNKQRNIGKKQAKKSCEANFNAYENLYKLIIDEEKKEEEGDIYKPNQARENKSGFGNIRYIKIHNNRVLVR